MSEILTGLVAFGFMWGVFFGAVIVGLLIFAYGGNSRTRGYRKTLTDMYVIGKLKQYAEKEKIDLIGLLREFKQLRKILRDDLSPDKVIEAEISEKINQFGDKNKGA